MSQYPSPYSPPPQYQPYQSFSPNDALAPARKAALLMFILGGLLLVGGGCLIAIAPVLPVDQMSAQQMAPIAQMAKQMNMDTASFARTLCRTIGILALLPGIFLPVMGLLVRRGGRVSIIVTMVAVGLAALYMMLSTLSAFSSGLGEPVSMCFTFLVLSMLALLLAWLYQAARWAPYVQTMRMQYQAQYWQYQQNQAAYGSGPSASGYGYPPPPPPASPTPPSAGPTDPPPAA